LFFSSQIILLFLYHSKFIEIKIRFDKFWGIKRDRRESDEEKRNMASATVTSGGITDVPANSVEIENLARFAVDDYNKKQNAVLEFVRVISAKKQDVSGVLYYITLEAKDGETKNVYETKVWVREWLNSKEVLEFKLVSTDTKGGGVSDVPSDTAHIENLARFAVDQYNKNQVFFYSCSFCRFQCVENNPSVPLNRIDKVKHYIRTKIHNTIILRS